MTQKYIPTKWVANETIGTANVMNNIEQGIVGAYDEIKRVDSQLAHIKTVDEFSGNDTEKIIKALESGVSIIDGQNKTYTITNEITMPSNIELRNIVILRGFDGRCMIRSKDNSSNIKLNNVTLLHNDYDSTALVLLNCKKVKIDNCYISTKKGFSIQLENSQDVNILNTKIENIQKEDLSLNYTDGIHIYGGCYNIYVNNCDIICGDDGIGISNEYEKDSEICGYDTIENIFISNCNIDTNARVFCITAGKDRISKSYFKNIHFNNIKAFSHGSIYIKNGNENVESEVDGLYLDGLSIKEKFLGTVSQKCYFENIKNSYIANSNITTKSSVIFKNSVGIKVINCVFHMKSTDVENVLVYDNVIDSHFKDITIQGNNTNVNSLNNCKRNIFVNYFVKENEERKANVFVGTGQNNIFKNFVLYGSNLIDFYIQSSTFYNNIIDGFVYYNSEQASNLSAANIVGGKITYNTEG